MRQKLFDDKYVGYHTFGLELNNVAVTEEPQSVPDVSGDGKDPNSPGRVSGKG